jgi:hypothetical protein
MAGFGLVGTTAPEQVIERLEDLENFARQIERGELNLGGPGAQAR